MVTPKLEVPALEVQFGNVVLTVPPRKGSHGLHGAELAQAQAAWKAAECTDARQRIRKERAAFLRSGKRPPARVDSARCVPQQVQHTLGV